MNKSNWKNLRALVLSSLFYVCIAFAFACSNNPKSLQVEKEVDFNLGFYPSLSSSGINPITKQFFFTNYSTSKQILLFDSLFNPTDTISLVALNNKVYAIWDMEFYGDKFYALTARGVVYILSTQGKVLDLVDMNKLISSKHEDYDLSFTDIELIENEEGMKLLTNPIWRDFGPNDERNIMHYIDFNYVKAIELNKEYQLKLPFLIEISLEEEFYVKGHLLNFYSRIVPPNKFGATFHRPKFFATDSQVSIYSRYSDTIWSYSLKTKKLTGKKIKFNDFEFVSKEINLDTNIFKNHGQFYEKFVNYNTRHARYLKEVLLVDKEKYLAVIKHPTKEKDESNFINASKTFLLLDSNLNVISEATIPKDLFGPFVLAFKNSFLITKVPEYEEQFNPNIYQFYEIKYSDL